MASFSRRSVLGTATMAAATLAGCGFSRQVAGGHLFVENRSGGTERIELSVTEVDQDGERLVDHAFEIPESHAIQYDDLLQPDTTYDVRAFQPAVPEAGRAHLGVEVQSCEEGDPSDTLDVTVLVSSNGPDITIFDCDRAYQKTEGMTYEEPSDYRVATLTETIGTPTPS